MALIRSSFEFQLPTSRFRISRLVSFRSSRRLVPLIIAALQQEPMNTCIDRAIREGVAILTDNVAVAADAECCRTQRPCGIYEPVLESSAAEKRMRYGATVGEGLAHNFTFGVDVPSVRRIRVRK